MADDVSTPPGRKLSKDKRAAILCAARAAFLEEGYAAASMNRVAEDAKVSKATLYNHFKCKPELFDAVVQEQYASVIRALPDLPPDTPPRDALTSFAKALIANVQSEDHLKLVRLVIGEQVRFPEISAIYFTRGKSAAYDKIIAYLGEQKKRGVLNIDDPKQATAQFMGAIKEPLIWPRVFGGAPYGEDDAVIASAVDMALAAWTPGGA